MVWIGAETMTQTALFSDLPKSVKPEPPTPLMAQYLEIKAEAGAETILFYRMGDFYEMFFNDAERAAPALDIVLTKRGKHQGAAIPMCGVPVHSSERYIQSLTRQGFAVAICEIVGSASIAKKRGAPKLLPRQILRVVTP